MALSQIHRTTSRDGRRSGPENLGAPGRPPSQAEKARGFLLPVDAVDGQGSTRSAFRSISYSVSSSEYGTVPSAVNVAYEECREFSGLLKIFFIGQEG